MFLGSFAALALLVGGFGCGGFGCGGVAVVAGLRFAFPGKPYFFAMAVAGGCP
jgi:hypothetical protein